MRKEWKFNVNNHAIRIANSWFGGIKLYIDGDFRDKDTSFFVFAKTVLLSARLHDGGILEISVESGLLSVEIDAHLVLNSGRKNIYSSDK
ncbi:MAG: hypothetical protein L3J24_11160 [Xanthomonadales bacterium]|nr:hypothetical protein [Xanthomonadales bacterium]